MLPSARVMGKGSGMASSNYNVTLGEGDGARVMDVTLGEGDKVAVRPDVLAAADAGGRLDARPEPRLIGDNVEVLPVGGPFEAR
jgi:hypothetical protein